jgi:hypothetical protein
MVLGTLPAAAARRTAAPETIFTSAIGGGSQDNATYADMLGWRETCSSVKSLLQLYPTLVLRRLLYLTNLSAHLIPA